MRTKRFYAAMALLNIVLMAQISCSGGSTPSWTGTRLLGTTSIDVAYGVAVASNGNVYITGYTAGDLDGYPNAGGGADIFLAKYDALGNKQWTRLLGSLLGSKTYYRANGVAVDNNENIYITGYTLGNLDGQINAGSYDAFLAKYDASGNREWTKLWGSKTDDVAYGVAVDSNGCVYITGVTSGDLYGQINASGVAAFLAKYDASGNKQWTRILESTGSNGVAVDSNGNAYITGRANRNFGGQDNLSLSSILLAKYDAAGNLQWTRLLCCLSDWIFPGGVSLDGNGNTYITGYSEYAPAGGIHDSYLVKHDASGNRQWTIFSGSSSDDWAYSVVVDSNNGSVYITGQTVGNLDGQINAGNGDAFLVKYDAAGNRQWTRLLGSKTDDMAYGVAVDSNGNTYITGRTQGNLDGQINAGSYDAFLAKYDANGVKQ